ncbi:hypothetical protein FITA111629_06275 [Filibacter tadaridae]|uniref:Uncharacterized protein n=1 Tax=Filibacter tadaridae TaxID=2483811 RepID=A0A3P5XFD8_9BACL|nr:hypothetical protein [Filibacter tadaridae]VDC33536.1 hypothetical protein FILTAD_02946 [Filibacter tadaridae]
MNNKIWKIGLFTGLISFVLLIFGVRTVLGQTLEWKNYIAFGLFGLSVGALVLLILFYELKIAFRIFMVAIVLGFAELFRSFLMDTNGLGDLAGILSLFIITSFGLGVALIVQFIVILMRKEKA